MASLVSPFSRLALRSSAPRYIAACSLSTSASRLKPAPTSAPPSLQDLPLEAPSAAASSSSSSPTIQPNRINLTKSESPGKSKTVWVLTRIGRARQLVRWTWLKQQQVEELAQLLDSGCADADLPTWLEQEHESAKSFCEARSRLWIPSTLPDGVNADSVKAWLERERASLHEKKGAQWMKSTSVEEHYDEILKEVWKTLPLQARENALIECRFSSLRKLGWRSGYSAGYPVPESSMTDERRALLDQSKLGGAEGMQALIKLQSLDDELAWESWLSMSPARRLEEEAEVWAQRDRSCIYLDNSPSTKIVGRVYPRWYNTPQRAGQLVFLPNFIIRLVKNHTPIGKAYDPWKATFRVPLNLHKHGLRSFLLSVYGLRTTWIRSMIYRASLHRGGWRRGQLVTRSVGTWKKVEVGLLEPFVFPTMNDRFKQDVLLYDDMKYEETKQLFRRFGTRRWRGGRPIERSLAPENLKRSYFPDLDKSPTLEEQEAKLVAHVSAPPPAKDVSEASRSKGLFDFTVKGGIHPSKRHSNILKVLNGLRKERMKLIDQRAEELKGEVESKGESRTP